MTWNPNVPDAVILPRRYRVRVRVYRAGEWVDITSRVASGVIRESNDQPVATLELRLLNGRKYPSLAPRRKDSPLNQVNGQYMPLLWIGRLIAVDAAFSEDGSEPDEWWPVFLGELEDEIDTESGPDGTYVRLFCRDMATRLQRAYIAGPWTFENMYASEMIQAILDHAYSEGLIPEPVQLRLIGPDDFWVERYDIEYTDLWSALQRFCQQRGTDLRYRLNEATGQIELTYWLPDRAMVPGWTIDASQVRREELRISGTDIINKVTVRYRDAQTGQRAEVTVQDADSVAMYGLRHGLIEEPDTDLIPDEATAQKLAQTIVEDLKDVPALVRLTVPFDPRIQLFDKLRVANPNVRDEPEDYAIESRELQFSATDWSMVLVGGGQVAVKRQTWLERLATEGVKQPFTPGDWITDSRPPAVTVTLSTGLEEVEQGTTAYVKVSWQRPDWRYIDRYAVRIRRLDTDEYQYQETTETSATFYGLLANVSYGVQVATIDGRGTVGEWSTEATITTPRDETAPAKPTGLVAVPVVRGFVLTWDHYSPPPPLSHWIVERASSADGFQTWVVVNAEVRSALYTDQDPALDQDLEYKYRVIAVSRTGIYSEPSDPTPPRKPGKVSLAEDVVDQLKREYLDQDFVSEIQDAQSRLEQAESGLQEAQNRLSGAEQRLDDAEDRLGNAENRLGAAEQRLTTAENQLVDARSRLTDAEERLDEAEQALEQVEGVVQEHTVTLQTHAQEIAARVTQQVFDSLEQRVTDAEAELSIHAQEIQARVERTVFDALKSTVESHTATLQVHAQEIAARVTQEVFDTLAATVSQHGATLQVHANAIAAKVEQIVFDALANRVSQAEAQLAVHADEIQARVKQKDFDDLEDRVTQAESTLTLHADQIATKVEQSVVDALTGRVSQAETAIQQKADKIELTALSQEVDTIEQRVTTAETTLTQKADKIELNAVSEEVDALGQRVTSAETTLTQKADKIELNAVRQDLDQLSGTVATHGATLQTHAQQIAARVTQEVFDVLEGRVTEAEAELNILADEIEARVEKTVFDTLAQTVAEHSATLDIHANEIAARVKQTVFDALEQRVTDAETTLQAHAGEIAARVTQTTFDALKRVVDSQSKTKPQGGILFPFDTTLLGTGGIKPLDSVATLRPGEGRFGGAVAVEEGTANLVPNTNGRPNTMTPGGTTPPTVQLVTEAHPWGTEAWKVTFPAGASTGYSGCRVTSDGWTMQRDGREYTLSVYIKGDTSKLYIYHTGNYGLAKMRASGPAVGGYQRYVATASLTGDGAIREFLAIYLTEPTSTDITIYVVASQVEEKPFATSFVNGTRAAGRLSYPKSLIAGLNALTVAAWTSGPPYWVSGIKYLVAAQTSGTGPWGDIFALRRTEGSRISLWVRNDANSSEESVSYDNVWDGNWHLIVGVINKSPEPGRQPIELYVDGELVASSSNVNAVPDLSNIDETWGVQVGNWRGLLQWNGLIDELLILPYAASEEEIRAWYEAQAPFYDPDDVAYIEQNVSSLVVTAQEISTAVANVQDGLTQAQSAIQQNADQIALRVQAIDQETGKPVQAALQVFVQDGEPYVLLDGRKVLLPGSLVADDIQSGTLRLTGDMAITNEEGTLQITSTGIEMEGQEAGGTQWTPGGLVFLRPDGTRSGYLRAVVPGVAQDGDYVPLNFSNEPVVILSPARAITYEPSIGGIQKLRLEAANVSPEGFQVVAKLVKHAGQGKRTVFPNTQKYYWHTTSSAHWWCTDGGHRESEDAARAWSEHRLRDVGDKKLFTTSSGTTGVIVRIREMLHAHAWAGRYTAINRITYRLRIRPLGSSSWLHTLGPFTRSITVQSAVLSSRTTFSHNQVTHVFQNLAPNAYEIEIEVTGKTLSSQGANGADAMFLLVEEIEEMSETEIQLPEPITVHYIAFESDNPGG